MERKKLFLLHYLLPKDQSISENREEKWKFCFPILQKKLVTHLYLSGGRERRRKKSLNLIMEIRIRQGLCKVPTDCCA